MGTPLSVTLPDFYKNLTLGNIEGVRGEIEIAEEADELDYHHIINLSGRDVISERIRVHDLQIDDKESLTFDVFNKTMLKAVEILENAEKTGEGVFVNCLAGCNRSVSAVVCYAVLRKGWKLKDAIEYVNFRKRYIGKPDWDTLGNKTFYRHLQQMDMMRKQAGELDNKVM